MLLAPNHAKSGIIILNSIHLLFIFLVLNASSVIVQKVPDNLMVPAADEQAFSVFSISFQRDNLALCWDPEGREPLWKQCHMAPDYSEL